MPTVDLSTAMQYQAHPEAWLLAVLLGGGYLYVLRAHGPAHAPAHLARTGYATRNQKLWFAGGVVLFWFGAGYPLHGLGEDYLYGAHMAQHLIFQIIAAPMLLLGAPAWMLRLFLRPPWLFNAVKVITRPVPAIIIVNALVAVSHTPFWVELSVANGLFHFVAHILLVVVGWVMFWPVFSPLPELPHYSYIGRMGYLFSHSIVPTVPASFLTFANDPMYPSYAAAPRLNEVLTPLVDMQIAGLLMKIGGGLLLWGIIAVLFFQWSREDRTGAPDFLYWRDYAGTDELPELTTQ
jgi:putative membrane protein